MNMTKLSVSSVVLAAALSGCSQQSVIGGSQVVNGSGGSQTSGGSQVAGGSQQQMESSSAVIAAPVAIPAYKPAPRVAVKRAPVRVYHKPQVRRVASKPKMTHSVRRGTGLPPAKPGQCFAKVKTAPKYITKSKRVFIQAASSKRVLVRAPQYRWISKKVLVRKAQYTNRTVPAQYRNQTKRVLVRPAYNTWKKGHGAITRIDNMTGQIMCRVTVPAQYKTVTKRVQVRAAQNIRKFIPAVYKTVKQKQRVSGAVYKTVKRPARYATKNYRVKVAGARYVWRPVLCATNAPKHYKHKTNNRKAAVMQKPVKRVHKQHYKRPAAGSSGISYAQYMAVMNAPLKSKPSKTKATKKKAVKKVMTPKTVAPKTMPKQEVKMAPKADTKTMEALAAEAKAAAESKKAEAASKASKTETKVNSTAPKKDDKKAEIQQNIVYGIQAALKSKGFNPGKLDGKMGANTAKALKAFQSSRGLPVGVLSKDTFRALGLVK